MHIYVHIVGNSWYYMIATMHACCSFLCESLVWFSVCFCFCVCVCLWFLYHYFVYVVIHSKQFTNNGSIKINENFTKHLNFTGEQIDRKNYIILHGLIFSYVCWFFFVCSCGLLFFFLYKILHSAKATWNCCETQR